MDETRFRLRSNRIQVKDPSYVRQSIPDFRLHMGNTGGMLPVRNNSPTCSSALFLHRLATPNTIRCNALLDLPLGYDLRCAPMTHSPPLVRLTGSLARGGGKGAISHGPNIPSQGYGYGSLSGRNSRDKPSC